MLLGKSSNEPQNNFLFYESSREFKLPELEQSEIEDAYDEIELLGFPVTVTSFNLLKTKYRSNIFSADLLKHVGKTVRILGDLVTVKNVRTVKKEWMHFGCFLDTLLKSTAFECGPRSGFVPFMNDVLQPEFKRVVESIPVSLHGSKDARDVLPWLMSAYV